MFRSAEVKPSRYVVRHLFAVLLAAFAANGGSCSLAVASSLADDQAAMALGRKVLAVRKAMQSPRAPNAMKAVTDLGHDQRYYIMVRGWLSYQLESDLSILAAGKEQTRDEVKARISFLKKAIRAIDLE